MEKSAGPAGGIVVVFILIVIGGIYFFLQEQTRFHTPPIQESVNV